MKASNKTYGASSTVNGEDGSSASKPLDRPTERLPSDETLAWATQVQQNMTRMTLDPAYRREIERRLSRTFDPPKP